MIWNRCLNRSNILFYLSKKLKKLRTQLKMHRLIPWRLKKPCNRFHPLKVSLKTMEMKGPNSKRRKKSLEKKRQILSYHNQLRTSFQWVSNTKEWLSKVLNRVILIACIRSLCSSLSLSLIINFSSLGRMCLYSSDNFTLFTKGLSRLNRSSMIKLMPTFLLKGMRLSSRELRNSRGKSLRYSLEEFFLPSAKL